MDYSKLPITSKITGIYYFEYEQKEEMITENDKKKTVTTPFIPTIPPTTTWSGRLECSADSPYAERLKNKCGGVTFQKDGVDWIVGYWTAPTDWPEMAAGRESSTPFSDKTYAVKDFPFMTVKA